MRRLLLVILVIIFWGCEDPPAEVSVSSLNNIPTKQVAQTQSTSQKVSSSGKISFNESPDEAMARIKASLSQNNSDSHSRSVISEIPSQLGGTEAFSALAANSPKSSPPPEITMMLEKAKNNKAMAQTLASVFSDLPQAEKISPIKAKSSGNQLLSKEEANTLSGARNSSSSLDGLNAGVRSPTPPATSNKPASLDGTFNFNETPTASPSPEEQRFITGNRPRGYAMLYMMHPRARNVSELQVKTLIDAGIENVYLGVLTDGTFGRDFDYLKGVLSRLSQAGRIVTFAAYISNGASMREHKDTPITAAFNKTDPNKFRELIQNDQTTQDKFRQLAKDVFPVFLHNKNLNPRNKNIAIPMLEDNLDQESYAAIKNIVTDVYGKDLVQVIRNPCLGCYPGNDATTSGEAIEEHGESGFTRVGPGDGFTFDGAQFLYPNEAGTGTSYQSALFLIAEAERRSALYVGLWRADWQGLSNGPLVHPDNRPYRKVGPSEVEAEINLLRSGLDQN